MKSLKASQLLFNPSLSESPDYSYIFTKASMQRIPTITSPAKNSTITMYVDFFHNSNLLIDS
ncbi:MAG: hypothetical protein NC453_04895 [Muribaculum sp.]|nr:hypothetical protein [Muribaculum sp.]